MKVFLVIKCNLLGEMTTFNVSDAIYNFVIWFQNNRTVPPDMENPDF